MTESQVSSPSRAAGQESSLPPDLERVDCPACSGARREVLYPGAFSPFEVARCAECGLIYLSTRCSEADMRAAYHDESYFAGATGAETAAQGYGEYRAQETSLRLTFRRVLENLQRRGATGGRLLEVGCGYGYFLSEARAYFSETHGTELNPQASAIAKSAADRVVCGGAADIDGSERFDSIVSLHVIEHVYQPKDFVVQLMQLLKPGGHILLATPDAGSFWRKLWRQRWPSWKLPEHVAFYDRHTLSALLKPHSTSLSVFPYPHAFPSSVIAQKFGISLPPVLGDPAFWIPKTTVAILAKKPDF